MKSSLASFYSSRSNFTYFFRFSFS